MDNVSAADLVSAWERALGQPPVHQALVLLSVAAPECSPEELARLSVGQRDARLLTLRERLFGSRVNSLSVCPQCQQRIELAFNVADVRVEPAPDNAVGPTGEATVYMDGYQVQFRLPNSLDLSSMDPTTDVNQAREHLLHRCIQSVVREGPNGDDAEAMGDSHRLPMTIVEAIAERMTEADPQADTRLALRCPDCRHEWHAVFDIATYLVGEIHNWVGHVLREVHSLARAYGWRESDILAMTATRRRAYLELLGQD